MKIKLNLIGHVFGLTFIASCVALQTPSRPVYSSVELSRSLDRSPSGANRTASEKAARSYGNLPLSFEVNRGQTDSRVKFLSRGTGYNLYLTAKEAVMELRASARPSPRDEQRPPVRAGVRSSVIRMKLVGANAGAKVIGLDELPGKSNYFIGGDPKKWRTNIPNYSRVKYENVYPGVDAVFYGEHGQLEYDLRVAPGADVKTVRLAFDGVRRVRLDNSGDLLIATSSGEIRERKPVIYQERDGAQQPVEGGYVIRGEHEVGFEVRRYDSTRALVIDPVMVYSTTFGGSYNETSNAIAVDKAGNAYIAGTTDSEDFPTANPFQAKLGMGVITNFILSDAFVAKLSPSGTALVYSTYLGGASNDVANGITVDSEGNAYVTGYAESTNFPTTPGAFQTKAVSGGSAFVTKLNAAGSALVYSTYLGGSGAGLSVAPSANVGTGIAVDTEGSAYTVGYTTSPKFPLKRAAQGQFNGGRPFNCCFGCIHQLPFGLDPVEDAFVTKLSPSGSRLVYSTYLGGSGQDEAYGIAIDSSANAYVTGTTCSRDFASNGFGGATDAFVAKLSSSGREVVYTRLLGGSGDDIGKSIAADASGNAYVAGQTDSIDFPATESALQTRPGGATSYATTDGGASWLSANGLPNSPVNVLALDPTNPLTIYAGLGSCSKAGGIFKSTDAGQTWKSSGLSDTIVYAIAVDPKNSSVLYADRFKSTDAGATWSPLSTNVVGGIGQVVIDPEASTNVYMTNGGANCGGQGIPRQFVRTTDGGVTWNPVRNGPNFFFGFSLIIDPKTSTTIYATNQADLNLYKSTDGGNTWRVPYQFNRALVALAIDPNDSSTLYLRDPPGNINSLFKTTDGGMSFSTMGLTGVPIKALAIDQSNSATLYAATGDLGNGGGVFKSTDGGQTWKPTDLAGLTVNTLAIDPLGSLRIYAGTYFDTDGFLVKVNASDGAIGYSTYLGTRSPDAIAGIGVDAAGNVYLTGKTFSDRFPTMGALQDRKPGSLFETATFATWLNTTGSALLFSTYLGSEVSFGSAVAVDAAGKAYITGAAGIHRTVPSAVLPASVHGGFDAFVIEIASPPRITGAFISGKNLIVTGEGFDTGAVILINGVDQRTRNDRSTPATTLIGKKSANNIGGPVVLQVRSTDGLLSQPPFSFTR